VTFGATRAVADDCAAACPARLVAVTPTRLLRDTVALSAGLRPPQDGWRNTKPHVAQTERLIADPIGVLPWQPMVLHRGRWPDGS
jgi:hypothetical protein